MRILADPWGWMRRREAAPPRRRRRLNWRLIAIVAALLLLSACAVAAVTGQFSQWFPRMGVDPRDPEVSEEVLSRTGTAIEQSRTVGNETATLNAAIWDGEYVRLSLVLESPDFPEELAEDSNLYTEECSLELPEEQRRNYLRTYFTEERDCPPEKLEERVQDYMEMVPSYFYLGFSQPAREGNTLTWEASMALKDYAEQPELTLHLENIAIYEKAERAEDQTVSWLDGVRSGPGPDIPVLRGPFDFTFTLGEPILSIQYEGDVEVTAEEVPFRFTDFEIGVFDMDLSYEVLAPMNPISVARPDEPEPEPDPDKLDEMAVRGTLHTIIRGLWTEDGEYVDFENMPSGTSLTMGPNGEDPGGNVGRNYPHPIDPATVTAVDLNGVRVELSKLERLAK